VIAQNCLYGATHLLLSEEFHALGLKSTSSTVTDRSRGRKRLNRTRAIYFETITNPLVGISDLPAAVEFARAHRLVSTIDKTFASRLNFRPPERGFDLSLHSCTQY
jgi:cystathionine beta-lyase/cystathionine gamma-synthase